MLHLLVSRVALKFHDQRLTIPWEEWALQRIMMYNQVTKPSIINQTNQGFVLVSLVDESISLTDPMFKDYTLNNEIVVQVPTEKDYPWKGIVKAVKDFMLDFRMDAESEVIVSRIDSDDLLHENFVDEVQEQFMNPAVRYVDVADSLTYSMIDGKVRKSNKYDSIVSPFVSVLEDVSDFKCLAYAHYHHDIDRLMKGVKSDKVKAIQVIHNMNLVNKIYGEVVEDFLFNKYGGYFQ